MGAHVIEVFVWALAPSPFAQNALAIKNEELAL